MRFLARSSKGNILWELIKFGAIIGLIVIPFRLFIAQPFIVNGSSMQPAFENSDYLVVDEFSYKFVRQPQRGEVVIFRPPNDTSKFFIKRIIGLPGEIVLVNNGRVFVSDTELPEPYVDGQETIPDGKWSLGNNEYFVMGDNRMASSDSRIWGVLSGDKIAGRALLRLWPIKNIEYLPGRI